MVTLNECKNCYNILKNKYNIDCPRNCDVNKAKQAVNKLYLIHHPDKGGDPVVFREIRECADMIIRDRCTEQYNINNDSSTNNYSDEKMRNFYETKECNVFKNGKLKLGYIVNPLCVKNKKDKDHKVPECDKGYHLRKGYTVEDKCIKFNNTAEDEFTKLSNYLEFLIEYNKYRDKVSAQFALYSCIAGPTYKNKFHLEGYELKKVRRPPPVIEKFKHFIYEITNNKDTHIRTTKEMFDKGMKGVMDFYNKNGYYLRLFVIPENRKPKKECEGGEVNRSPKTKKCMKTCKTGYERSLTTNRCKKI